MITGPYRGSRFEAGDVPLLDAAWEVTDEIEADESATIAMEVLAGNNYRRQLHNNLVGAAYVLQVLLEPNLENSTDLGEWMKASNGLMERFAQPARELGAKLQNRQAAVVKPRSGGPFGAEKTEDMITVIRQPFLMVHHRQGDDRTVQVRAGVVSPYEQGVFVENDPNEWNDNSVQAARRGHIVVPSVVELFQAAKELQA